jgi:hypothetical protein
MKTILWLDDVRDPIYQSGFCSDCEVVWVKSYDEFVEWIEKNSLPDHICFDHDLEIPVAEAARAEGMSKRQSGKLKSVEKTGYDCAKWLVNYCIDNNEDLPTWSVHSMNPEGNKNIALLLRNFENRF